jgi:hypothetical protein
LCANEVSHIQRVAIFFNHSNIHSPIQEVGLASLSCVLYRKSEVILKEIVEITEEIYIYKTVCVKMYVLQASICDCLHAVARRKDEAPAC